MCRWLVAENRRLYDALRAELALGRSRLGSVVAQRRFIDRLSRSPAARALVALHLIPGKRAKFKIQFSFWGVITPSGEILLPNDPMPEKPWLTCGMVSMSKEAERYFHVFTLTHHAMQRLAERCEARTPADLIDTLRLIYDALAELLAAKIEAGETYREEDHEVLRIDLPAGVAIAERAEGFGWLIKTVVPSTHDESGDEGYAPRKVRF
jgi:hypothetical protein